MNHHSSCRPNDISLMRVCSQCGEKEWAGDDGELEPFREGYEKTVRERDAFHEALKRVSRLHLEAELKIVKIEQLLQKGMKN